MKSTNLVLRGLGLIAIASVLLFPLIITHTSSRESYLNVVIMAATSAILTLSLNICMGYGGLLSLAHTGMQMVGGYAIGIAMLSYNINPWVGILIAALASTIFSILMISISLRATYLYFGMITLAANLIAMEGFRNILGNDGLITDIYKPSWHGEDMTTTVFYYVTIGILAFAYVIQRNTILSGFGRATMALRESSDTASALGVSPNAQRVKIFAVAGGIAGVAGAILAMQGSFMSPEIGDLSGGLIFFVGLFLGGVGTLVGPIAGVALIATIGYFIRFSGAYRTLILGSILLLCMMVLPRGIVGTFRASRWGSPKELDGEPEDSGEKIITHLPVDPEIPVIEAKNVVKHFGGIKAVDGVSLVIRSGSIHGIIGPNGSGKSTLVSCITRYHKLTSGEVLLFGKEMPRKPHAVARGGVTRVFQVPHLFERVSVRDNVLTGMRIHERYTWIEAVFRLPRYLSNTRAEQKQAVALLKLVGLGRKSEIASANLSHGQKRLLEIVRAVSARPRVLILDEPATGLSKSELVSLHEIIVFLKAHGLAVVLIEHNVEFLMGLADIVTVLESGKVIAEDRPEVVRNDPRVIEAYLGRTDISELVDD
jgi:ABC-type branched-subunit amino acid transport system ATPase component/ABC-type branched-subunit amino acid transport system permease subunit